MRSLAVLLLVCPMGVLDLGVRAGDAPVRATNEKRIQQLIALLGSEQFSDRDRAEKELIALGSVTFTTSAGPSMTLDGTTIGDGTGGMENVDGATIKLRNSAEQVLGYPGNDGTIDMRSGVSRWVAVTGDFWQTANGVLAMSAVTGGLRSCSRLTITGTASLNGTMTITAAAALKATDTLVPVTYGAVQGTFNGGLLRWDIGPQGGRIAFDGTYNATNLTLKPPKAALVLEGDVFAGSSTDAEGQWLSNVLTAGEDLTPSDFTLSIDWGDGTTSSGDIADDPGFSIVAGHLSRARARTW